MKKIVFIILILISIACSSSLSTLATEREEIDSITETFTFKGQVSRGQTFEKEISEDLLFRLVPTEYANIGIVGWQINIINKSYPEHELASVATPPFRGQQALDIVGWHFRNDDNSEPFVSVPGGYYKPQKERQFSFVLTEESFEMAIESIGCIISTCDDMEVEEAIQIHEAIPKASANLTINQLDLGNLIVGERAWIENMEFTVEIELTK